MTGSDIESGYGSQAEQLTPLEKLGNGLTWLGALVTSSAAVVAAIDVFIVKSPEVLEVTTPAMIAGGAVTAVGVKFRNHHS